MKASGVKRFGGPFQAAFRWVRCFRKNDLAADAMELATGLFGRFRRTGDPGSLDDAIRMFEVSVQRTPAGHPDHARRLYGLATALLRRFEWTQEPADLDTAITAHWPAVVAAPAGSSVRAGVVTNLGIALRWRYGLTDDPGDLDAAITAAGQALDRMPDGFPERAAILTNLGAALLARYRLTGQRKDLDAAMELAEQSVTASAVGDPGRAVTLANLSAMRRDRYWLGKDPADLDAAVDLARRAVTALPPHHLDRAAMLAGLRGSLRDRYDLTGQRDDLDAAISAASRALNAAPQGGRQPFLLALGDSLLDLYHLVEDPADAVAAVEMFTQAVAEAGDRPPPGYLNALGKAQRLVARDSGSLDTLEQALAAGRRAVDATPSGDADRVERLTELALTLKECYELTAQMAPLAEAIDLFREAVDATCAGSQQRAVCLSNLANALWTFSVATGEATGLPEAVQAGREAATIAGDSQHLSGAIHNNLALALGELSVETADLETLRYAVQAAERAVAATPRDNTTLGRRLDNLRELLWMLYAHTGQPEILAKAEHAGRDAVQASKGAGIDLVGYMEDLGTTVDTFSGSAVAAKLLAAATLAGRDAVARTPASHAHRGRRLARLGSVLRRTFDATGEEDVLREAVSVFREALGATPGDHPGRAARLEDLALALLALADHTGEQGSLEEGVDLCRQAVAHDTQHAGDHTTYLMNLGRALRQRFESTGAPEALQEAVEVGRLTVAAGSRGRRGAVALVHLGLSLAELFEATRQTVLLDEYVSVSREAVDLMPNDHFDRPMCVGALGDALLMQFYSHDRDQRIIDEAQRCWAEAASSPTAPIRLRILNYQLLAAIGDDGAVGTPGSGLAAMEEAIALLPRLVPRHQARDDREHTLKKISSLPTNAAVAALAADRPERAVELLEASRGVLVADTMDARSSDLNQLRNVRGGPALAEQFEQLRQQIETLDRQAKALSAAAPSEPAEEHISSRSDWLAATDLAADRRQAYADWDALLAQIRASESMAGFMQPSRIEWFAAQASEGHIVFITADSTRCDALILNHDVDHPVTAVRLGDLTEQDVSRQTDRFLQAIADSRDPQAADARRVTAETEIHNILAWLWDCIAEPVLTTMHHTGLPGEDEPWPRVWWCPVGRLALLPLHAAGHHLDTTARNGGEPGRAVLDRVVSSYTVTVRALAYARRATALPAVPGEQIPDIATVVIAEPGGGDIPFLAGAGAEARELAALIPGASLLEHPGRESVLAALQTHGIAHFACHGLVDWQDPGSSRLILHDHQVRPLTVREISGLHLMSARLAYLSACETAVTSGDLADEAVHIAAAFQLAGYEHVIGTLWPVNDAVARDVALNVYDRLTAGGENLPDTRLTAVALHRAVRRARDVRLRYPTSWAAYLHMGA